MAQKISVPNNTLRPKNGLQRIWLQFRKEWRLHLMLLLPVVYFLLFHYLPMYGLQIAFRDYKAKDGIFGSEWVGLKHFKAFFEYYGWDDLVVNTLLLSLYSILAGFPIPIFLAMIIHVNDHSRLKKVVQNISYVPHFISTVVLVGIINQIFDPVTGVYGTILDMLGKNDLQNILRLPETFRHMYVWSDVWQNMGWDTIIYVAALSGVSQELHEAAMIDGASRWRRVLTIDLPAIMPTIAIMMILRFGGLMSVGFEKVYLMQNDMNIEFSEVIATYTYKFGLGRNKISYGSAVGIMNSVINTSMLIFVNWISRKVSDDEVSLF